jgi:hypothetical protein
MAQRLSGASGLVPSSRCPVKLMLAALTPHVRIAETLKKVANHGL